MGCKQSTARQPRSRSSSHGSAQQGHQHQHQQHRTSASSNRNSSSQHRQPSSPATKSPQKASPNPRLTIQSQNLSGGNSNLQSRGSSRNPSSRSSPQQTPLQKPTPLQSRHSSQTQNNSKVIPTEKLVPPPKPLVPPPQPTAAVAMSGRLGRPYLYRQQSPISSTSSSSYFNSTDEEEDEYDDEVEAALLMTPRGSRSRSRDSSPTSDSKTIHVNGSRLNRSFTNSARRRAAQGRLNRSRRRASLHANARDEFVQKAMGPGISGSPTSAIDYSRAGGSFIDDPHVAGGHIGGNDVYYDGGEGDGQGGFFAGERQFLPYKYKNVHDAGHYCSSTAMVVVAGGASSNTNGYRGGGMGSVTKSSSSPLGFRRARRKHFKHNSSQGTIAGSPCGPGSAVLSSSSPLGFRRSRRGHAKHGSSAAGSPSGEALRHTTGSTAKFHNSSSTTGPTNANGSNGGSVGSGPINHDASVAYSSPNHDFSVGNMIMSRTLGPPETTPYYFASKNGSNNSHNTANNGYNSSQTGAVAVMKNGKGIATTNGLAGGGSVSGYHPAANGGNNIFYQKGVVAREDEDEYFI